MRNTRSKGSGARLRKIAAVLAGCAAVLFAGGAAAQAWPSKPIQIIIPLTAGGNTDAMLRLIMPVLAERLGQPFVLVHKPGANMIIGTEAIARSAPDGHTIGLIADQHSVNPNMVAKLPFDPIRDFEPVTRLINGYFVLLAYPGLQMKSLRELIAAAKARPGKLSYASPGIGSPHHLAMVWLARMAGVQMNHVPYKGASQMIVDGMAGHVDVMFMGTTIGLTQVSSGKFTGVAVSSPSRLEPAPDIPTVAESGLPEFSYGYWWGVLAPAGTPREIVGRLSGEIGQALLLPETRKKLTVIGLIAAPSSPEEFRAFLQKDIVKYAEIVRISGAKSE